MNGLQIDINTGDLLVERSAAVVADASGFIAELVLRSCRGEFKEHPRCRSPPYARRGA